jgi:tetratricopeptide (TPR) repeat protein
MVPLGGIQRESIPLSGTAGIHRAKSHERTRFYAALLLLGLTFSAFRGVLARGQAENSAETSASSDTAESYLSRGYNDLKNDRYEEAVREFRAALERDPSLVLRARFPLAVALFESHQPEEARREFEAVRREVGDHPNVMYYLGRLDLAENHIDRAIEELSKAASKPPYPDTAYYLGYAYLKQGNLSSAEKWLRKAAELTPRDPGVQYRLGFLYRQQGREEEAQKAFTLSEQLRQRAADESRLKLECAQKLEKSSLEEARAVCQQLYDPDDPEKLTLLGTIYGEHGNYEDALKPLRRAAELSPHSPQMQYNLALAYFRLKKYEEAHASLEKAVNEWRDLFELKALDGAILFKLGEEPSAYRVLSRAHNLNPQDPETTGLLYEVTLALAEKSQASKQYTSSLRYLTEAAKLRPNDPEPHRRMAEIYNLTGQQAQAAKELQMAQRLSAPEPHKPN